MKSGTRSTGEARWTRAAPRSTFETRGVLGSFSTRDHTRTSRLTRLTAVLTLISGASQQTVEDDCSCAAYRQMVEVCGTPYRVKNLIHLCHDLVGQAKTCPEHQQVWMIS